ncbi:protein of unknown function [Taphrina deformans PYCC 5710]|uniref:Mediator of RNA polymerase II transcription subunit 6 n=1 Tax=Taphrina deformans (strain PYCC 5710 / ATCC 11124 / CBS 356.35 / IMI 108563 / JCM 9778 / NBRC 8474) TaxID=1097556 RepID=R4XGL3_TAPDE|nr:protein of unknown function [Taphrina deformans PYCC 5710]|eukprot:CCG84931.1 protein of unknown function [Taphrina deformans PYCC 5710]
MQSQFQSFGDVNEALKKMTGIEFVVSSYSVPDLFTINKQERESAEDVRILNVFLVANGNVYLAPDAHRIVTSRVV